MSSSTSNSEPDSASRGVLRIFAVALALVVAHSVLVQGGVRARLAESGAQTSLINAQDSLRRSSELGAVIAGSSLTARLNGDFLSETGYEVGSLGMDGQGPAAGLRLLLERESVPSIVLIEANSVHVSKPVNEQTVLGAINAPSSAASAYIPSLRAEGRVSSTLYHWAKLLQDGSGDSASGIGGGAVVFGPPSEPGERTLAENHAVSIDRLDAQVGELTAAGTCVVLYWLPSNGRFDQAAVEGSNQLAWDHDLFTIDLRPLTEELAYSDGLHLDVPSARFAAHVLIETVFGHREEVCRP